MASPVIHMAVANEINKKLKRDNNKLLIGSIAPDISKLVSEKKIKSYFSTREKDNIPNIESFLKNKKNLNDNFVNYIYNDYTNININLIENYTLNLSIFYNDIPYIEPIIEEIPMDKLYIIINKAGIIITNSKNSKSYLFDMKSVKNFISFATKLILSEIEKL